MPAYFDVRLWSLLPEEIGFKSLDFVVNRFLIKLFKKTLCQLLKIVESISSLNYQVNCLLQERQVSWINITAITIIFCKLRNNLDHCEISSYTWHNIHCEISSYTWHNIVKQYCLNCTYIYRPINIYFFLLVIMFVFSSYYALPDLVK